MKKMTSYKIGDGEIEAEPVRRKRASLFSKSRDIREDRGERKEKFMHEVGTILSHRQRNRKNDKPLERLPEHSLSTKCPVCFKLKAPEAKSVSIGGTFNNWNHLTTPLQRLCEGEWMTELFLEPGTYQYRFFVDDQWVDDPAALRRVPNGLGGQNCVVEVLSSPFLTRFA